MPLTMNPEVFITCAITGSGATQDRSPHVPRSPEQIANSAIDAAKAGAAVVHCHVRDPESGAPSRRLDLYREVTDRIRESDVDVVLNLTAGMGGDLLFGPTEHPLPLNEAGTDMIGAAARVEHIKQCLPEICTLDCGTMNFAEADYVMCNTPGMLQAMGRMMTHLGVKPEIEAFDTGHLWYAKQLVADGVLDAPALVQLCMGVPWGAPDDLNTLMAMVNNVPKDWTFSAFALGRHQMPYVAATVLAGGNVRVGLEDNLMLDRGVLATNAQLVERAAMIVGNLGARVIGPDEVRVKLGLTKRAPEVRMIARLLAIIGLALLAACVPGAAPFGAAPEADGAAAPDPTEPAYVLDDDAAPTQAELPPGAEAPLETAVQPESGSEPGPEPEPDPEPAAAESPPEDRNAPARAECLRKGGSFARTQSGGFVCVIRTRDALKACTRSSQCEGACLARSGTCAPVTPLIGCHDIVTDSGSMATVCID